MNIQSTRTYSLPKEVAIKYCQKMVAECAEGSPQADRWESEARVLAVLPGKDLKEVYDKAVARSARNIEVLKYSVVAGLAGLAGTMAGGGLLALANLAQGPLLASVGGGLAIAGAVTAVASGAVFFRSLDECNNKDSFTARSAFSPTSDEGITFYGGRSYLACLEDAPEVV
jgi:hypothetical protein